MQRSLQNIMGNVLNQSVNIPYEYDIAGIEGPLIIYRNCYKDVCVKHNIFRESFQQKRIKFLRDRYINNTDIENFENTLKLAIMKAMECCVSDYKSVVLKIEGIVKHSTVHRDTLRFHRLLESWEQKIFAMALYHLTNHEDAFSLQVTLALACRGSQECKARVRASFDTILARVQLNSSTQATKRELNESSQADDEEEEEEEEVCEGQVLISKRYLHSLLLEAIEEFKDQAFQTTFIEPSKMYLTARGDRHEMDVEVHGSNVYLAILLCTLGIQFNRKPLLDDPWVLGCADFLSAGMESQIQALWSEDNFGKSFESVSECRGEILCKDVSNSPLLEGKTPIEIATSLCDPYPRGIERRSLIMPYLTQFCSYFRPSFLLPRLISRMLQDEVAERHLDTVFEFYRFLWDEKEEDVRYWLWDVEEVPPVLHIDRALKLFSALKLTMESTSDMGSVKHTPVMLRASVFSGHRLYIMPDSFSGMCLSVHGDSISNISFREQFHCQWECVDAGEGTVYLQSVVFKDMRLACNASGKLLMASSVDIVRTVNTSSSSELAVMAVISVECRPKQFMMASKKQMKGYDDREEDCKVIMEELSEDIVLVNKSDMHALPKSASELFGNNHSKSIAHIRRVESDMKEFKSYNNQKRRNVDNSIEIQEVECKWVLEDKENLCLISSAAYRNMQLRSNPQGQINTTSNRRAWEKWRIKIVDDEWKNNQLDSPFSIYTEKRIILENTQVSNDKKGVLVCNQDGTVAIGKADDLNAIWCLYDAGNGTLLISNALYADRNLQCNSHHDIRTSSNCLEWEQWVITGLTSEASYISSFTFQNKYLAVDHTNRVVARSRSNTGSIWAIKFI
mmetsp:Transcript_19115/g.19246  ORF Transcript_19115/g.19246 Transcript_19115/m.19246 type:complete len:850 (+) Transcript_19115:122-2671(+)